MAPLDLRISCCLITASDATLTLVRRDPALYWRLACPEDVSAFERARAEERTARGPLGRLLAPAPRHDLDLEEGEGEVLLLGDRWAGVDHLLAAPEGRGPLAFLRSGGHPVAADAGYGPPQLFDSGQVRSVSGALGEAAEQDLRARFDPARMNELEVHPGGWCGQDLASLLSSVAELRTFVARAAKDGLGLVVELS